MSKRKGLRNLHILLSAVGKTKQCNMGKGQVHGCIFLSIEESRKDKPLSDLLTAVKKYVMC